MRIKTGKELTWFYFNDIMSCLCIEFPVEFGPNMLYLLIMERIRLAKIYRETFHIDPKHISIQEAWTSLLKLFYKHFDEHLERESRQLRRK